MRKTLPYILSLFLLCCANVALAVNNAGQEKKEEKVSLQNEEKIQQKYSLTLINFLQPFHFREKSLP